MSTNEQLALQVLSALDIALFRRVSVKKYEFLGQPPAFYGDLFPPSGADPCVEPWKHSSMLEIFFEEAELFFTNRKTGSFSSGIWQEEGKTGNDSALIAMARIFDPEHIITIRLLQDDFNERAMILGKARAQLLENRALSRRLELYREKSQLDGLTQLLNRATFMDALPAEMRKAQSNDHPLAAIMLDIDDFKVINDTLGHITGDRVLQELSRMLRANLRQGDIVARYGGEEFIILLPACELQKALTIAEKLRKIIESHMAEDAPKFTVSMGCGLYQAEETPDDLIHRVDMALYEAKRSGKNQVRMCC